MGGKCWAGHLIADEVLGERQSLLEPFRFDRFEKGNRTVSNVHILELMAGEHENIKKAKIKIKKGGLKWPKWTLNVLWKRWAR